MRRGGFVRTVLVACFALGLAAVSGAQTTRIHVVLDGADQAGAEVYVDGQLRGRTDGAGNLDVERALLTDGTSLVSARLQVYEVPAFLPGHEDARSPSGWVMRAYVTSVLIDDAGVVNRFLVTDRTATQELVLKRDNALIGLHVLASADWDMSEADIARLMQTFQQASWFLWNATDGQFVFERVKIADQGHDWDRSEFRLNLDNTPTSITSPGGFLGQNTIGQLVGSFITLAWRDLDIHLQGPAGTGGEEPAVWIHEFGHLAFDLADEYGDVADDVCTPRRRSDGAFSDFGELGPKSACIMDDPFKSRKFCSDQGPNPHNYTSRQPEDCWAEIRGHFSDPQGARWILKTPVTRGAIVGMMVRPSGDWFNDLSGALPPEWNTEFVVTNTGWPTELCRPFLQPVTFADGSPARWSVVKLLYTSIDASRNTWNSEGKTLKEGDIAILGAHEGDTVMTEREYIALTPCPNGVWPQGPLGLLSDDRDGDRVLDAFDICPSLFNPYERGASIWARFFSQSGTCPPCGTATPCGDGLVCREATGECVVPACRSDADCGRGRRCGTIGTAAVCMDLGTGCTTNAECPIGRCDVGDGTSKTGKCVPAAGAGETGALCSHDDQCRSGNCSGLQPDGPGAWRPGTCAATGQKGLGEHCFGNAQCVSGYCDAGDGTSKTGLCMPNRNGQPGEICSHDYQCASRNCGGLAPTAAGGWQPGRCSASDKKPLGDYCFGNSQCESAYCDAGEGTSKTNRCMPNRDGQDGQICSHDNQCASLNCSGVSNLAAAVPGTCAPKRALGVTCSAHNQCASAFCDAGFETSYTYRCMPNRDGRVGDICSHDKQCALLNCSGLVQNSVGEWVPGVCAAKRALGDLCSANNECNSAYCDAGDGTSKTSRCMPNRNGRNGDPCSNDNQCASLVCAGLARDAAGNWMPGTCATKLALNDSCTQHYQCASGYCDSGWGTSQTDRCRPNGDGRTGDVCSHPNQCASRDCVGLRAAGNVWIPGTCR